MEKDTITELLETILKALASKPEEVNITKTVDEMGVLFLVKLGDGDAGLIIGRQGRTIQSVRAIMAAVGMKNQAKINIKLDVPERVNRPMAARDNFENRKSSSDDLDLDKM